MRVLPRITVDGHAAELICTLPFAGRCLLVRYAGGGCQWVDPGAVEIRPAEPVAAPGAEPITDAEAEAAERVAAAVAYRRAVASSIQAVAARTIGGRAIGGRA